MKNRVLLHIIAWSVYLLLTTFYKTNNLGLSIALQHSLLGGGINLILFYSFAQLGVRRYLVKKQWWAFALVLLVFFILFVAIKYRIEYRLIGEFYDFVANNSNIPVRRLIGAIVLSTLLFSTLLTTLESQMKWEEEARAIINQQNEAQLIYLKSQINPHFLFNSLNNIYSLAVEKSDQTPKMILQLSTLLRYSIYESQKEQVPLRAELNQIEKYLDLFITSQEEPPNIRLELKGEIDNWMIEPMILIPLVENCLKHGDFNTNPNAFVAISLLAEKDHLWFKTHNSKNDADQQKDKTGGVGLQNIQKRLALKYPERHQFEQKAGETDFEVNLKLRK
ncbi:MAG: histidine kinase [Bacteroidota bacterium]